MDKNDIPFDGFGNVVDMLVHADDDFRAKILRNIARRDRALAERILQATNREINNRLLAEGKEPAQTPPGRAKQARTYGSF